MEHYLNIMILCVHGHCPSLVMPGVQTTAVALVTTELDLVTQTGQELVKLRAGVIVTKDVLFCKLVLFLKQNPKLVVLCLMK